MALVTGKTSQQRILAGFFVFLVHSSHRCSNGQRTRKLQLSDDAILGESLLKGNRYGQNGRLQEWEWLSTIGLERGSRG